MNSLFSAIGHGAMNISLPKIASNTFNTDSIKEQAKSLLGNSKIPSPTFTAGKAPEPDATAASKATSLTQQIDAEQANYDKLLEAWKTTRDQYGPDDKKTTDAFTSVFASAEKIDELEKQVQQIVII